MPAEPAGPKRASIFRSMNPLSPPAEYVVIKGMTADGQVFRPSDWAHRLALAATAGTCPPERPACFRPEVRVATAEGAPALLVHRSLAQSDPVLFSYLLAFARQHGLLCTE